MDRFTGRSSRLIAYVFAAIALAVVVLSQTLDYVKSIAGWNTEKMAINRADQCAGTEMTQPKENPNKMLFISCGGFLD